MAEKLDLIRFDSPDFRLGQLALVLSNAIEGDNPRGTRDLLDTRHLWGVLERYSGSVNGQPDKIKERLLRIRTMSASLTADRDPLTAYCISVRGLPVGLASIQGDLPLRRQRIGLPAFVTRHVPFADIPYTMSGPNVCAWIKSSVDQDSLVDAYSKLGVDGGPGSWTIEPDRSPQAIHEAIVAAGFQPREQGRFDDFEAGDRRLPISTLYMLNE